MYCETIQFESIAKLKMINIYSSSNSKEHPETRNGDPYDKGYKNRES